jgi:hypothetical protein
MKAGRIHRLGAPEVVVIDEIPRPELNDARRANEMLAGLPQPKGKIPLWMPSFAEP